MRRRTLRDHNGITLVEIIIVLAILGILTTTVVGILGHLHYADTQKVVKTLDSSLDALQVKTMSKTGSSYMYVYKSGNNYYMRITSSNLERCDKSAVLPQPDGPSMMTLDFSISVPSVF